MGNHQDAATSTDDIVNQRDQTTSPIPAKHVHFAEIDEHFTISDVETESDSDAELQAVLSSTNVYTDETVQQPVAVSPTVSPILEEAEENCSDIDIDVTRRKSLSPVQPEAEPNKTQSKIDTDRTRRKHVDTDSETDNELPSSSAENVEDKPTGRRPARKRRVPARYRD
jgi:hypothetical protein